MNEKYKFTIDKLVSIKEIIKSIEETNYIDGYLGYEDGFYIDSILYYLKENARLKDKIDKAIKYYELNQQECVIGRNKDEKLIKEYYLPAQCSKKLLDILKEN